MTAPALAHVAASLPPLEQLLQNLRSIHALTDKLFSPDIYDRLDQSIALLRFEIRRQLVATQQKACDDVGLPMLMPSTGICYRCGADLLEGARIGQLQQPITGCARCLVSYCD